MKIEYHFFGFTNYRISVIQKKKLIFGFILFILFFQLIYVIQRKN
jgi:hypothetical protein